MTQAASRIAAIFGTDSAQTQALLAALAAAWCAAGLAVAGVLAEPHGLPDRTCSAGILRDIASGRPHRMYLETAPVGTSCHLDAIGVAGASEDLLGQIAASDIVVLNKFGKLEAAHGGLMPAFAAAITAGKPVLTSVSALHRDAWRAFAPDAVTLPADAAAVGDWLRTIQPKRDAAAAQAAPAFL
jgi:Protein of unknown function (DUF2478)